MRDIKHDVKMVYFSVCLYLNIYFIETQSKDDVLGISKICKVLFGFYKNSLFIADDASS